MRFRRPIALGDKPSQGAIVNHAHPLGRRLVGAWLFDEPTDMGIVRDRTRYGTHGTRSGTSIARQADKFGWSHNFTGDANNDRYDLGSIPSTHPLSLSRLSRFTIIARVYKRSTPNSSTFPRIIDKSSSGSATGGWYLGGNNTGVQIEAGVGGSAQNISANSNFEDRWHTVGLSYDGTLGHVFCTDNTGNGWNPRKIGTLNISQTVPTTTTNAAIGNWNHTTDRNWEGRIDYIHVWDDYFRDDIVKSLMAQPFRMYDRPRIQPVKFPTVSSGGYEAGIQSIINTGI